MTVRTRIAPSPTGDPHVGTGFIAVMNYLFARSQGGTFILRIEDTDRVRSTAESEQAILRSLRWLGLSWSEGPDIGGDNGPYRQSERGPIYERFARDLLDRGHAFRCFCTPERLEAMRAAQQKAGRIAAYDGCCLHLSPAEAEARHRAGEPSVIRMKVPETGTCAFSDMKRGEITIPWANVDMQVLVKSDGMPTYHLANVVDDHLMGITHVIRGEEWVASTPKHVLLYSYFGWTAPHFCHMPLLRNPDRTKLSKRKSPTSMVWFERMGILPEALTNMLGLYAQKLDEGSEELLTLADLERGFGLDHVSLGGPVFDLAKLTSLNSRWLRERLTPEQMLRRFLDWMGEDRLRDTIALAQTRVHGLGDILPLSAFLWSAEVPLDPVALCGKHSRDGVRSLLTALLARVDAAPEWSRDAVDAMVRATAEETGLKLRDAVRPLYVALTGAEHSLPLFDSAALLGKDMTRHRLRQALRALSP